jgi:hypothetical protein
MTFDAGCSGCEDFWYVVPMAAAGVRAELHRLWLYVARAAIGGPEADGIDLHDLGRIENIHRPGRIGETDPVGLGAEPVG